LRRITRVDLRELGERASFVESYELILTAQDKEFAQCCMTGVRGLELAKVALIDCAGDAVGAYPNLTDYRIPLLSSVPARP
jgi:hypothetical protein